MGPALEMCQLQTEMVTLDPSVMMDGDVMRPTQSAGNDIANKISESDNLHYIFQATWIGVHQFSELYPVFCETFTICDNV